MLQHNSYFDTYYLHQHSHSKHHEATHLHLRTIIKDKPAIRIIFIQIHHHHKIQTASPKTGLQRKMGQGHHLKPQTSHMHNTSTGCKATQARITLHIIAAATLRDPRQTDPNTISHHSHPGTLYRQTIPQRFLPKTNQTKTVRIFRISDH